MDRSEYDQALVQEGGNDVRHAKRPEFPSIVPGEDIVTERCVVLFDVDARLGVSKLLKNLGRAAVDAEQAVESVWTGKHPERNDKEVEDPEEDERIVLVERLAEFIAKVENGCVVNKHEKAHDG